jgi:hypothetical protein
MMVPRPVRPKFPKSEEKEYSLTIFFQNEYSNTSKQIVKSPHNRIYVPTMHRSGCLPQSGGEGRGGERSWIGWREIPRREC